MKKTYTQSKCCYYTDIAIKHEKSDGIHVIFGGQIALVILVV